MYDVFFLSYDEPYAEQYWTILKGLHPTARRCTGVAGIQAAHKCCAEKSRTRHFFVVDADNLVIKPEVFSYQVPTWDAGYVHLWYAENPLNRLSYGWGGIKLFPKTLFRDLPDQKLDMTTSFPLKIMEDVVSITYFNASPFETWRSAFRECVKLVHAGTEESLQRAAVWQTTASGMFAEWCVRGARDGARYAEEHRDDVLALMKINDYTWLRKEFELVVP